MGRRAGPEGEEHAEERPGGDLRELVHVPDRVPVPDDRHPRLPRGGGDSDRLLHFGRDLEVPGWPDDLPDHHLQVAGRDEAWPVIGVLSGPDQAFLVWSLSGWLVSKFLSVLQPAE